MATLHISRIQAEEPAENCDIHMGTFSYQLNGIEFSAEFYLRTCQDDREHQFSDYNEQLTDEWEQLMLKGSMHIGYQEIEPCPI
jgi:hypothetical protein